MTERAVVFKTPGNLDLRALTIFGMNAKPNTVSPIGFFGTGLKYATAILAREQFPITIHTNGVKWTVDAHNVGFRGKAFQSVILCRHRKFLGVQQRDLPFTTELGKSWELWQAFRELYSNTLDEDGEVFITDEFTVDPLPKNHTYIVVEGEQFVRTFFDKDRYFLPDALRNQQTNNTPVQVFERPSDCVYYRGIRIFDFPKGKTSQFTYNILMPISLTEDRTAKYSFEVYQAIEHYAQVTENIDHIRQIIAPQAKTVEKDLTWGYGHYSPPSKQFLDTVEQNKTFATPGVLDRYHSYRPKPKVEDKWLTELINLLKTEYESMTDLDKVAHEEFGKKAFEDRARLLKILQKEAGIETEEIAF